MNKKIIFGFLLICLIGSITTVMANNQTPINETVIKNVTIPENITDPSEITVTNGEPKTNITVYETLDYELEPNLEPKPSKTVSMKNTGNNLVYLALAIIVVVGVLVIVRKRCN